MIMRRAFLFALLLLLPLPAAAELLGDAKVPFSADRTVVVDGRSFTGRLFAAPGKQRHEQDIEGISQVILLRADGRGWLVVPNLKSYVEFGFAPVLAELGDAAVLSTPVGQETVAGQKATKYRVEHTARDGTQVDGWLWRTAEGIIVKMDGTVRPRRGKPSDVQMTLGNIRKGPQDANLFELPQGLVKLPSGALAPLLGGVARSG
jgi:hypothetical protein